MSLTPSTMLPLGTKAPDFTLPDPHHAMQEPNGKEYSLSEIAKDAKATVVIFMCNHCPYVKHIQKQLAAMINIYQSKGVAAVAINSNDVQKYPDDSPDLMIEEIETYSYTFPYLLDSWQDVAKSYQAACTPDFFLFDQDLKLVYRGRFDESRPESQTPVTGKDLSDALDAVLEGKPVSSNQKPSMGCNIKWLPANEPSYI